MAENWVACLLCRVTVGKSNIIMLHYNVLHFYFIFVGFPLHVQGKKDEAKTRSFSRNHQNCYL